MKPVLSKDLSAALTRLLMSRKANTQEDLCLALEKQGYDINQSKIARRGRKMGSIKILNAQGQIV